MSLFVRRESLNVETSVIKRILWKSAPDGQSSRKLWQIGGIVVSVGLIAVLVYYAEAREVPLRQLYRYLFLLPIALAAYNFGVSGGLSTALACTVVFFPILVQSTRRFGLSDGTLEILSLVIFFNLFAFVVANLADFQHRQERLQLILKQISGLFEKGLDVEQLSAAILSSGMEICQAEFGEVVLWDEVAGRLQVMAQQGSSWVSWEAHGTTGARGACLADWLIANNQALLVNHLDDDPRFARGHGGPPIQSLLAVPLRRGSQAVGFIALMNKQGGLFAPDDLENLAVIAERTQMAIENARLYEQTDEKLRQRVEEFASLAQLGMALSATLDLEQSLEAAVTHATQALGVAMCDIRMVKGDALAIGAVAGDRAESAPRLPIKIEGRLRQMIEKLQPLAIADLEGEPVLPVGWHRWLLRTGIRAYLGMPLVSQGQCIGVLGIYRQEPHEWVMHEMNFVATIANNVASALANAQLFKRVSEGKRWTELVLGGIADGVMTTDRVGRIRTFNPAAERITGWTAEEAIGRSCCEMFRIQDGDARQADHEVCPHQRALSETGAELQPYKALFIRADGAERILAIRTAPLRNQLDEPIGTVSIFRDISREEHLDRLKSDFISIVSHELRAPLTNILASVDLLRRTRLEPRAKQEVVEILYSQSRRLNRFVEDILNVSRLDTGEIQVQLQPVALRPLVWRAIDAVQGGREHHRFEVRIQADLPCVLADESKLEIVLHNLLTNAVRYSHPGSVITVEAHEGDGSVVVSVVDEGIGVSPEHQKHIFERFYRADTAGSRRVYGYGLGLYICKRLVEAQGGHIWVESQEGVGSRFSFALQPFQGVEGGVNRER